MKTFITSLSLVAASATEAWAQGYVTLANAGGATAIYTNMFGNTGLTARTASSFYYDVLINASTVTTINSSLQGLTAAGWSDSGITGVNDARVLGAGKITSVNTASSIWAPGTEQSAVVICWSANIGTTVQSALAAVNGATFIPGEGWSGAGLTLSYGEGVGYTTIAQAIAGASAGSAAELFSSFPSAAVPNPISTPTTLIITTPEPGTLSVAGLGVGVLLTLRWRTNTNRWMA
jgi:hypothetical protein